jgi:hypothetical protein
MSKTYRRKKYGYGKGKVNYDEWVISDYVRIPGVYSWLWKRRKFQGHELKEAINHFHSDAGVGDRWPVPAWFRRESEQIRRAKMKAETHKILKRVQSGDRDIYHDNYLPLKKDVSWDWW